MKLLKVAANQANSCIMALLILFAASLIISGYCGAADDYRLPPGEWERLKQGSYTVYYEAQDRDAAEQLLELYTTFLEDFARKLQLEVPEAIKVFIAPNEGRFRYLTRGMPEWTGGAFYPRQRVVVLKTPRKLSDKRQYSVTALHEGVHLLTELDSDFHLPKWLAEGLAVYLSGETLFKNRVPLARAVVLQRTHTLDEIDDVLKLGPEDARVAYLQSINLVEFLVENYGWDLVAELVRSYRAGENPDQTLLRLTGKPLIDIEIAWHQELRGRYKWWKLVEWFDLDMALWGSASLLVMVVGSVTIYRRRRYLKEEESEPADLYYSEPAYWEQDVATGEIYDDDDQDPW